MARIIAREENFNKRLIDHAIANIPAWRDTIIMRLMFQLGHRVYVHQYEYNKF